jgi:hypothetical protein
MDIYHHINKTICFREGEIKEISHVASVGDKEIS